MFHKCPYCGTKYKFKDVIWLYSEKKECDNCKKTFYVNKSFRILPFLLSFKIVKLINDLLAGSSDDLIEKVILWMFLIDAVVLTAALVISQYFVIFRPIDNQSDSKAP